MTSPNKELKKLPYHLLVLMLTGGASLILGVLSFSGMYALIPMLPLAFGAMALSVAYEGEVYLQNIKGALNKLFANKYLQRQIAKQFLLESFPDTEPNTNPQFFKDYVIELNAYNLYRDKSLNAQQKRELKRIKKTLTAMEHWFAEQLFRPASNESDSTYALELSRWLEANGQDNCKKLYQNRKKTYNLAKAFSTISAFFMGLGTSYLLVEAFTVIPALAALSVSTWPFIIIPAAIVAGIGSGLLTYNAVTDLINNDTINKWYHKIKNDLKAGITFKSVFMASAALFLSALAVALTLCTAGTWWTVVKEAKPLFAWMHKIPSFVMTVINPIVTGLSAILFNIENTSETLELVDEALEPAPQYKDTAYDSDTKKKGMLGSLKENIKDFLARENWLQIINPTRLLLKLTYTPLKILLFLGHLMSIAVTSDRVPGVPQALSALLGLISEGFEDAHYFLGRGHGYDEHPSAASIRQIRYEESQGHSHHDDLPSRALKLIFLPLFFLSATWDYLASQMNTAGQQMRFKQAWNKHTGQVDNPKAIIPESIEKPSHNWQREHAIHEIESFKSEQLKCFGVDTQTNQRKTQALTDLQAELRACEQKPDEILRSKAHVLLQKHGMFSANTDIEDDTVRFLDKLPARISL